MTTTTFPDDEEDPFKSSASVFNNKERILSPTVPSETGSPFGGDMPNYE